MQKLQLRIARHMRPSIFLVMLLMIITASAAFAQSKVELAPEEQAYLDNKNRILSFVADPDWYPYEYINENGQHEGIAADYLQILSERLDINFKLIPTRSWLEATAIAKSGQVDLTPILNKTPERSRFLDFTTPIFSSQMVLIGKDKIWHEKGLADLKGYSIAVVDGYWFSEMVFKDFPYLATVKTQSIEEALLTVDKGKAYATAASIIEASYQIRKNGLSTMKIIGHTKYSNNLRMGIRKDDPLLLSIIQKGLDTITKEEKETIRTKWVTEEVKALPKDYTLPLVVLGFLLVVALAGFYIYRKVC